MKPVIDLFKMYVNGETICVQNDRLINQQVTLPSGMNSIPVRWKTKDFTELSIRLYSEHRTQLQIIKDLPASGEHEFYINQYSTPLYVAIYDGAEEIDTIRIEQKSNFWEHLFSFEGRIRRSEYCFTYLFYCLLFAAIYYTLIFNYMGMIEINEYVAIFLGLLLIPLFWIFCAQGAKRCHDRGNSGWFQLIPLYFFIMLFGDGERGSNEYGASPKYK
ncbi:uncharacterized membrane protein YhaH (DUF805 family) [Parabacteroides sp. PF5-5]|uniref:DUF805 domain-containing protein n=1 Tax=unclassified Parabacteroides TaxID=2649774 RepID=UPI002475BA3D|nr:MULTISPECIES: DUF805 domain-containing protein [unclassified Parabacteroides]MDH6305932.1 uncharacterized membrane protein YhaH (DUF805 family) [Parabacteroides sp. PH5-39]MDH6316853.1 uncharacterized membrane protein YhaH (DUF805 family) [Parabacteroides sp. PF5-13]MDH6320644.1 uncharacterized membrane protein YhaH (DUF805 family) [Parabacteroides sp. PH5-13]MDH6324435.1 uncharacterized membrane protein YhaH (DUF805 family) [Parabacteroides sp. PH5-8]MDH6328038.1 uncharacterized membrane p